MVWHFYEHCKIPGLLVCSWSLSARLPFLNSFLAPSSSSSPFSAGQGGACAAYVGWDGMAGALPGSKHHLHLCSPTPPGSLQGKAAAAFQ